MDLYILSYEKRTKVNLISTNPNPKIKGYCLESVCFVVRDIKRKKAQAYCYTAGRQEVCESMLNSSQYAF